MSVHCDKCMTDIQIGYFACFCCCLDAFKIETQEDVREVCEDIVDGREDGTAYKVVSSVDELDHDCDEQTKCRFK